MAGDDSRGRPGPAAGLPELRLLRRPAAGGESMSFIHVGDYILNLMAVSIVGCDPDGRVTVWVVGRPEPLTLFGDDAARVWEAACQMATPIERLLPLGNRP